MGWERRGNAEYYYRSYRVGHRVRKEYLGRGTDTDLLATLASQERHRKERACAEFQRERQAADTINRAVDTFEAALKAELRRQLERAGFRQHNRGEWRRRRVQGR